MRAPGRETCRALLFSLIVLAGGAALAERAAAEVCGDFELDPGETCDDGNTASGDGCDPSCVLECGNGTLDMGEDCDDGGESAACDDDCTPVACGDGNVNETAGEHCEPADPFDPFCLPTCKLLDSDMPFPLPMLRCLNRVAKDLAGVVKAQSADNAACLAGIARGQREPSCVGADLEDRVARARARIPATFAELCAGANAPYYGLASAPIVSAAGVDPVLASFARVFGATPTFAPRSDRAGAACQAHALRQHDAVLATWLGEAERARKTAMLGGRKLGLPPFPSDPMDLADRIDAAIAESARLSRAAAKARARVAAKCSGLPIADLFDCAAAADVASLGSCVVLSAGQAACEAMEQADGIDLDCPQTPNP